MRDEISIFIIAVKSLEVYLQFVRAWASLDIGDLIQLTSKYLTGNTPPWQNHGWKSRKQNFYSSFKRRHQAIQEAQEVKRMWTCTDSLFSIAFIVTSLAGPGVPG